VSVIPPGAGEVAELAAIAEACPPALAALDPLGTAKLPGAALDVLAAPRSAAELAGAREGAAAEIPQAVSPNASPTTARLTHSGVILRAV